MRHTPLLLFVWGCFGGGPNTMASGPDSGGVGCGPAVVAGTWNMLHGLTDEDPEADEFDRVGERLAGAAAVIRDEGLTVLLVQEVVLGEVEGYPDVGAELLSAVGPGWTLLHGDILGHDLVGADGDGWGQATLTCLPVNATGNHMLSDTNGTPRSVSWVQVQAGDVGLDGAAATLDIYNAHTSGNGAAELGDLLAFVDQTATGDVALLGGDLNQRDTDGALSVIRDAGFVDLGERGGLTCLTQGDLGCTGDTMPLAEAGNRATVRIDYLWQRGGSPGTDARPLLGEPLVLDEGGALWPSDHIGVRAEVNLTPP